MSSSICCASNITVLSKEVWRRQQCAHYCKRCESDKPKCQGDKCNARLSQNQESKSEVSGRHDEERRTHGKGLITKESSLTLTQQLPALIRVTSVFCKKVLTKMQGRRRQWMPSLVIERGSLENPRICSLLQNRVKATNESAKETSAK